MPDNLQNESQGLRDLYQKLQSAEPNDTPFELFVSRLKQNEIADQNSGITYRDVVMGKMQHYYNDNVDSGQFNNFVDQNISFHEQQKGRPVFSNRQEMSDYFMNKQVQENPYQFPVIEDHGGDPYMGVYPDGTFVDESRDPLNNLQIKDGSQVWDNDVNRQIDSYNSTPIFPEFKMDMNNDVHLKESLYSLEQDALSYLSENNPDEYDNVKKQFDDFINSDSTDYLAAGDFVKSLAKNNYIDVNDEGYKYLISSRDSVDPDIQKQNQDKSQKYSEYVSGLRESQQQAIDKAKKLRELNNIESALLGGVDLSPYEKTLLLGELADINKEISTYSQKIKLAREESGIPTAGMTDDEKQRYNAENAVIQSYNQEWSEVMSLYDMNYMTSPDAQKIEWNKSDADVMNKSVQDYLDELETLDYDKFVESSGKSDSEVLKDYAYKKFWPEFKQMVANYDPSTLTNIVGNVFGDLNNFANIADVADVVDTSNVEKTSGEPEEEYVRSMLRQAMLLYYMANEGADPTDIFGKDYEFGDASVIPGIAPITQPVLRGAHEAAMGAVDFVGLEGVQTGGATIRDDLMRKSVVSKEINDIFSKAGIDTPENIRSWTKPSNWDRIQDLTTDVTRIAGEFLIVDLATGGLGGLGLLSKTGNVARSIGMGSKSLNVLNAALKTEKGLKALSGSITNTIRTAETIAATSSNPAARFFAKRLLQGGSAIKEGVKYEIIGNIFKDDALDFGSGFAGYYGKSVVNSVFDKWLPASPIASKVKNFFGAGIGEVAQESMQEISQQGLDSFLKTMQDPTERSWFLASSFILGGVMGGGADVNLQDWALENYQDLDPKQKNRFDEMTGRIEWKKAQQEQLADSRLSPFARDIKSKMSNNMSADQRYEIRSQVDTETDKVIDSFGYPVSDSKRQEIKDINYDSIVGNGEKIMSGDIISYSDMAEVLMRPVDVSKNYSDKMTQSEKVNRIQQDIMDSRYESNNVFDEISKLPDGQTKDLMMNMYKQADKERSDMFKNVSKGVTKEIRSDANLEIDPTEVQGSWDSLQDVVGLNRLRSMFQDQDVHLKKMIDRIKKVGGKVNDFTDTYLQLSLSTGRVSSRRFNLLNKALNPKNESSFYNRIKNSGGDIDEYGKFLYSLNAKEKNAKIRDLQGENTDLTSGMTDAEADAFISELKESGKYDSYMEIEKDFRSEVIDPILDEKLQSGIISQEEYETLRNSYEYYVPTKLNPSKVGYDESSMPTSSPRKSKGIKKLKGGKTGSENRYNPFLKSIDDHIASVITSERNNNVRSFADLIRQNNLHTKENSKFRIYDKMPEGKDVIDFFEDGQRKYLEIKDPDIKRSIVDSNLRDQDLMRIVKAIQPVVKFKRMTSTMRNPAFVPKNFLRDFGMAAWRLDSLGIKGVDPLRYTNTVRKSLAETRSILKAIKKGKEPDGEWGEIYNEAVSAGAITTYADFIASETRIADLQKEAELMIEDPTLVKKVWDGTTKWIEDLSDITERGVRLATYRLARESGMSVERSAFAAREVTMNFDRKGTLSWATNTAYMFSNAKVQGTYNLLKTLGTSRKAQMTALAVFTGAILSNVLNDSIGDDEENDSIFEFDRENNFVFLNPLSDKKGDYFKLPVPQGLSELKYMGDIFYDLLVDKKDVGDVVSITSSKILKTLNPLEGATVNQSLAPTFMDPIIQHQENVNYFGGQLAPENKFGSERVQAYQSFSNSSVLGQFFATKMNQLTGGNKVERGLIDMSPNVYDNYFQFIFGGTGKFYTQSVMSVYDTFNGEFSLEESKPPVVSSFYRFGNPDGKYKSYAYQMKNSSSAMLFTPEDWSNLQTVLDRLVEHQEMSPDKASNIAKTIRRNQTIVKFGKENNMTFDEARVFMKGK